MRQPGGAPGPNRPLTDRLFSPSGPDADRYGAAQGFPVSRAFEEPLNRVGSFSHFDTVFPTRRIGRAARPWAFERIASEFRYTYQGTQYKIVDYLARNPVTGLLVIKGDDILFEHYQYGRSDRDRLSSMSMVKSIVGLLVGVAIAEGAIAAVDDPVGRYVRELDGSEYGKTLIRDLLHMSSGVYFGEDKDNARDLNRLWLDLMGGYLPQYAAEAKGTIGGILRFNRRVAPPGNRFFYASIEADVLGLVVRRATGKTLSDYLRAKIWDPMGAEADATWLVDAQGFELAHGFLNAVLRDYGRLGHLLAHEGARGDKQIVPARWISDATTVRPMDGYLAPGHADPMFGYGYLTWLLPWGARQFALFGAWGQRICVDPASRIVMVHTAVEEGTEIWSLWGGLVRQFGKA